MADGGDGKVQRSGNDAEILMDVDMMPRDAIVVNAANNKVTQVWGAIVEADGKFLRRERIKVWNRAGETLLKTLHERGLERGKPVRIKFTGNYGDFNGKREFNARLYDFPLEPGLSAAKRRSQPAAEADGEAVPKQGRPKREASEPQAAKEVEFKLTGLLEKGPDAAGRPAAFVTAIGSKVWDKEGLDRTDPAKSCKIKLSGDLVQLHGEIGERAAKVGRYFDLDQPLILKAKGIWQKGPTGDDKNVGIDGYNPFTFIPETVVLCDHAGKELVVATKAGEPTAEAVPQPARMAPKEPARDKAKALIDDVPDIF